jgi:hypothetical protein
MTIRLPNNYAVTGSQAFIDGNGNESIGNFIGHFSGRSLNHHADQWFSATRPHQNAAVFAKNCFFSGNFWR